MVLFLGNGISNPLNREQGWKKISVSSISWNMSSVNHRACFAISKISEPFTEVNSKFGFCHRQQATIIKSA
jgi:hypothetical protein